ncbi:MAG: ABC transporter permease [Microbacteriaceae bacterium]
MTQLSTSSNVSPEASARRRPFASIYSRNARSVFSRGLLAARSSNWLIIVSGFFEPVLYLLAMGVGLGSLIGNVTADNGQEIGYAAFIAPALLVVSAMNGAIYDSTWNVFFKMHFGKLYEGMLYTPLAPLDIALGEIILALLRGVLYASGFLVVMQVLGLNVGWSALLVLPAVMLIAFAFASLGMGITSYMKTFQHMDWINFVLLPMFLFSATFYPLSVYPGPIQWVIQAMPLWHGVELVRTLTTIGITPNLLWHVLYFVVMTMVGLFFTVKRLRVLFLK